MKAYRVGIAVIVAVIVACLFSASVALASGGIFLADLRITNDGKVVLADDFHTDGLSGWTSLEGANIVFPKPQTSTSVKQQDPPRLYLNAHASNNSGYSAQAWHDLHINGPGVLEMSVNLYVEPAKEQYMWQHHKECLAYLKFFSMDDQGNTKSQVAQLGVQLNTDETACRLYVYSEAKPNAGNDPSSKTKTAVLSTGKWVSLVLRLDPATSLLSLTMDGQALVTTPYEPTKVTNIGRFGILTAFGDGSQRNG